MERSAGQERRTDRLGETGQVVEQLSRILAPERVLTEGPVKREALSDGTANRGLTGSADALVEPESTEEVAAVLAFCYENDLPVVTRGGGTGLAGGAVPSGGVVLSLRRLDRVRSIEPGLWRMEVEAGVTTGTVHRLALENGLLFPPDPGASEQSTIGGNVATNAGGPHTFRYGVTGKWVTGLEVVIAPGEVIHTSGPVRKDVAGLDLTNLMIGSEGTLGIVTAAWLRLVPAPEARGVAVAFYETAEAGCEAITGIMASGIQPTALEFLDRGALAASLGSFPFDAPAEPGFAVLAEADGSTGEVARVLAELREAMATGASSGGGPSSGDDPAGAGAVLTISERSEADALWAWRDGVSYAVAAQRGGKISEDIVVPGERLIDAVSETVEIGARHGLEACSWGHAGDGNLHSTFLVDLDEPEQMRRGKAASDELFEMAIRLGGSISGEHGIGSLKTAHVKEALGESVVSLQAGIKRAFDPKLLLNPGKKIPLV
jgi:glycolate oxidase subunit GlcD